jgi:uncharacterized membrane protein YkvA (DUF1232 family)
MAPNINDILVLVCGIAAAGYLLNFGFGVVEFIPDNIPIIGNLDETVAAAALLYALRHFGLDLFALVDHARAHHRYKQNMSGVLD